MPELPGQQELFDLGERPEIPLLPHRPAITTFTKIRPLNRVACEECISLIWGNGGVGPYANSARWRVRFADGTTALLCHPHADARR